MPAKKQAGPARKRIASAPADAPGAPTTTSAELDSALADIHGIHGDGLVVRGDKVPNANHSPTGVFSVDLGLCGGIAEGFASMIYGFESSGKTLLALLACAGYLRKHPDKIAVFVDAEKLYDKDWAAKLGVDTSRLRVITPDTGEQAIDAISRMMYVDVVGMVVLDSLPSLVPKAVVDRSAEDKTMGALAALLGILCSKIIVAWGRERRRGHRVSVINLNQWRMKVGGFVTGDPRTLPGGRQINHLPTTKIAMRGKEEEEKTDDGDTVRLATELFFKFDKTKHGKSINAGAFTVVLGGGHESGLPPGSVDDAGTVTVYAFKFGLAGGGPGRYRLADFTDETFRKKENITEWLRANPHEQKLVRATMIAAMRQRHGMKPLPPDNSLEGLRNVHTLIDMQLVTRIAATAQDVPAAAEPNTGDDEEGEGNEEA
jgi:recombination protein RecA